MNEILSRIAQLIDERASGPFRFTFTDGTVLIADEIIGIFINAGNINTVKVFRLGAEYTFDAHKILSFHDGISLFET